MSEPTDKSPAFNPYMGLNAGAYWKSGVAQAADFNGLWVPKFALSGQKIATAGSCFAQHIGRALTAAGVEILRAEAPLMDLAPETAARFGYGLYSGRHGNIYTARALREFLEDITTQTTRPEMVWQRDGRHYDALRPAVEPDGCASVAEVLALRAQHLADMAEMLTQADVFIFTLGLTEMWQHAPTGRSYAMCPGVVAGEFDPKRDQFHNLSSDEVVADLRAAHELLRGFNRDIKMLLTVSPVPLTATASGQHVLAATNLSKARLVVAAHDMATAADVDYFPSYDLVTSWAVLTPAFLANQREVRPEIVAQIMGIFLTSAGLGNVANAPAPIHSQATQDPDEAADPLVCEDLLLDAFSK